MPLTLSQYLSSKGFKVKNGNSHKIIRRFERNWSSDFWWEFLKLHPSYRVLFNTIIKSGNPLVDPSVIHEKIRMLYQISKTSSVYISKCHCGGYLDRRYIFLDNFALPIDKEISCPHCSVVHKLHANNYEPFYEITFNDLLKLFNKLTELKYFLNFVLLQCIYCDAPNLAEMVGSEKVDLRCNKCHNVRLLNQNYLPLVDSNLIKEKQGYWFEWYVWRQLKDFNALYSKLATEKSTGFEFDIDVCLMQNDELVIFECKDSKDVQDTLANLHLIDKIASKFFLVSTHDINKKQLAQMKSTLGEKFYYISPPSVDTLGEVFQKR